MTSLKTLHHVTILNNAHCSQCPPPYIQIMPTLPIAAVNNRPQLPLPHETGSDSPTLLASPGHLVRTSTLPQSAYHRKHGSSPLSPGRKPAAAHHSPQTRASYTHDVSLSPAGHHHHQGESQRKRSESVNTYRQVRVKL